MQKNVTRYEKLTCSLDLPRQIGLEVGPLCHPVVSKESGLIYYADVMSTEELKRKYSGDPSVDVSRIVDVDYVTGDRALSEVVESGRRFDYIILSHAFEHLPSPLAFLDDLHSLLRPRGLICCAVPDMRRTFDRCRRETSLGGWLEALFMNRRTPGFREVFDHFCDFVGEPAGDDEDADAERSKQLSDGLHWAQMAKLEERYIDVHVSVFTPSSLLCLLRDSAALGLLAFELVRFWPTAPSENEFFLVLRRAEKTSDCRSLEHSYQRFLLSGDRKRGERDTAIEEARLVAARNDGFDGRVFFTSGSRRYWITDVNWAREAGFTWPDDIEWLEHEEIARQSVALGPPPSAAKVRTARQLLGFI